MSTDTATPPAEQPDAAENPPPRPGFTQLFGRYLIEANSVMVTVYSLLLAFLIGAVLLIVSDENVRSTYTYFFARPQDALTSSWILVRDSYLALFEGAILNLNTLERFQAGTAEFGDLLRPISETLLNATPLIFTGLAVGLAFRAGLFNIGAQGQLIFGMLGALAVGFSLNLPAVVHLPLAIVAGALAGAAFGAIPGVLKATTGAHEVISSIMLNNIAFFFLVWAIGTGFFHSETKSELVTKPVDESATLPTLLGWLGAGLRVNLALIVGLAAAVFTWWLLSRSTFGFRIRAVGFNAHASATAGMHVGRTYASTMAFAGGLAGLAGAALSLGVGSSGVTTNTALEYGFDGITVALLGRARPGGIVAAALLFGALKAGALSAQPDVPVDISTLLQAIIVLFIAAPALVKAILHLRTPRGGMVTLEAKGW
ncbi:ABC transporter permease [Glycomyces sp. TRM65418]|uniref:ABC transporter permease n=1 Tax=Glycomyces sp. TRM65418 TaxID=2867006 RepID=UPI001CE5CD92|nr:ABC transporter permease [Glycomyces sp. TRM65418]MCC3763600.1 ABC transporter permease [Glycomyces sp. TRM65418]QZD57582.1 ABC transporter permease [Glycomyces sp. TRM65418]